MPNENLHHCERQVRRHVSLKPCRSRAATFAILAAFLAFPCAIHAQSLPPQPAAAKATQAAPKRHSRLPTPALEKAREAEKQLAANAPEKAIAILRELDKQFPNHAAISLRLAQIYDTLSRYGYALFYYRRYVSQAGENPRDLAVERVRSLELMAGINAQVDKVESEMGEETRPVATPVPIIKRMLATEARDGSLVPIRNEEDFNRIQREGVPETSPEKVIPTPQITPIVIPPTLSKPPTPTPQHQARAAAPETAVSNSPEQLSLDISSAAETPENRRPTVSDVTRKKDEDALLAAAFRTADSPQEIVPNSSASGTNASRDDVSQSSPIATPPIQTGTAPVAAELAADRTPSVSVAPPPSLNGGNTALAPAPPRLTPGKTPDRVAFTQQKPMNTGRAADFFHVTDAPGQYALVSLVHDVPASMLTFNITPMDDGEVMSAILAPKEQKRVYMKPGTYNVSVNVSTTDYSPITLMNTHFQFTFSAGKQYTRRFNKNNIQQLN